MRAMRPAGQVGNTGAGAVNAWGKSSVGLFMRKLHFLSALAGATLGSIALAGCGVDSPYQTPKSVFLVPIATVDSGVFNLTNGVFDVGGGTDSGGVIPAEGALPRVFIPNGTKIRSSEQIYDLDSDHILDYFVVTIRALSAQGANSDTAVKNGVPVPPAQFWKVGGAAVLPLDTTVDHQAEITLPVNSLNADTSLELYRLNEISRDQLDGATSGGRQTSGTPSVVGQWVYVSDLTTNTDGSVTFKVGADTDDAPDFGQFAVVSDVKPTGAGS